MSFTPKCMRLGGAGVGWTRWMGWGLVLRYLYLCLPTASLFYPYGLDQKDQKNPKLDDGSSKKLSLAVPFTFYSKQYQTLYVREPKFRVLLACLSIFHLSLIFFFAPLFNPFCHPEVNPSTGVTHGRLNVSFSGASKHPCRVSGSWRSPTPLGMAKLTCATSHLPLGFGRAVEAIVT